MIQVLLLDLDGTVADTHELIYQCFSETFHRHAGRQCSRRLWEESVGLPLEQMFAAALQQVGGGQPSPQWLAQRYRERLAEIDGAVRAFPGIPEALTSLRQSGIRPALVTSKHEPIVSRHVRLLGLEPFFEVMITGDQCERSKPDPEPFLRALALLDVSAAAAAAVGDSVPDLIGARAAGVLAVAACWGTVHRAALLSAGPDRVLEQPADLLSLVEVDRASPFLTGETACESP